MDEKTILALFDRFNKSDMAELTYTENGNSFTLRRREAFAGIAAQTTSSSARTESGYGATAEQIGAPALSSIPAPHDASASSDSATPGDIDSTASGIDTEYIKSPIVGTFYRSASPDTPPFAEVNGTVAKGQKLCIIEAMKMMNALESEFDCRIEKILVNNGDMVEYDQPLFEIVRLDKASGV